MYAVPSARGAFLFPQDSLREKEVVFVTMKELRLRRIRNDIRAQALADCLGKSRSWIYQLERYYQGPSLPQWRERYAAALQALIDAKRHPETTDERKESHGGERPCAG